MRLQSTNKGEANMAYSHIPTDALHGDEPEIDALANRAEAGRDVDAEIDRKLERMDAEDAKRKHGELRIAFRYRVSHLIDELAHLIRISDVPGREVMHAHLADNVVTQAERLQALCREMAK